MQSWTTKTEQPRKTFCMTWRAERYASVVTSLRRLRELLASARASCTCHAQAETTDAQRHTKSCVRRSRVRQPQLRSSELKLVRRSGAIFRRIRAEGRDRSLVAASFRIVAVHQEII
jgi:hypothetical protein